MPSPSPLAAARQLMTEFAARTGLAPVAEASRRYLWTDAFAVCNFLELYRRTGEDNFLALARRLVDQVHQTLGRHRPDEGRSGWLSGLDEEAGRRHPTAGGLRIGKKLNERGPADPYDDRLEWERDGQYYHYLTKWMHALHCLGVVTADSTYNLWARELVKAVHPRFIFRLPGDNRQYLHWKMSIDLSRPLVPSMGQHDPLDGLITYRLLQGPAGGVPESPPSPRLDREIAELAAICQGKSWATDDPLGIGGLLCGAWQLAQLLGRGDGHSAALPASLLPAARAGLDSFAAGNTLRLPADYRLAFRELGLAIGLHAVARLGALLAAKAVPGRLAKSLAPAVAAVLNYQALAGKIEDFWLTAASRGTSTWLEHRDINTVMLATSLVPDGFLLTGAQE
jgi:hypothetical protein